MARVHSAKKAAHIPSKPTKKLTQAKPDGTKKNGPKNSTSERSKGKSPVRQDKKHDSLREEIIALGGDEDDYKLLKDVDSDKDVIADGNSLGSKKDAALSRDLENFMKSLNFSSVRPGDTDESEAGEDVVEESEPEEEESDGVASTKAHAELSRQAPERKEEKQKITVPTVGPNSRLLLEATPHWYTILPPLPPNKTPTGPPSQQSLSQKQSHASSLHSSELSGYESATSSNSNTNKLASTSSDFAFLQKILTSGTLSDRLSALTLMAQSSPLHNTRALETLRGMASKKGREESLKALRAIVDWWVGGGAPDRKLRYFIDQPLTHPGVTDKHLLLWHFEDWLKKYFYSILQILETLSLDPLPYIRLQAMTLIFTLLRDKPEQEQNLLRLLVNKLGDSERSVASRASYYLLQLLQTHPSMKAVVVREISSLVLKPSSRSTATTSATGTKTASGATHLKFTDAVTAVPPKSKTKQQQQPRHDKNEKKDLQQEHSRYYAAITLNQIMLSPSEADRGVAKQLISLYFELFKEILGSPSRPLDDTEDAGGSTVDHSRYGKEKRKKFEEKMRKGEEKGKGKNERVDREGFAEVEDSNSKLISAILTGVNRALPFAKMSLEDVEFSKHIDTLFLISHKSTFNISLQSLRLIMQICLSLSTSSTTISTPSTSSSTRALSTSITDRYYRTLYASLQDTRLNSSSKHAIYLNLLLKSLKMDTKPERVKAFVKRFVQLLVGAGNGGVEFVVGGLYLLGELFKAQPSLRDLLAKPRQSSSSADNGESPTYDPKKRDPQYANADASPLWELIPLLSHYHPTVRLHASQLLSEGQEEITATADLSLNTLSHFLDRFVYKNPKKILKSKGPSAMQPSASINAQDGTSIRIVKGIQKNDDMVNEERFWKKAVKDVPVDQVFFHKYFSKKNEKGLRKAESIAKRKGTADEAADNDSEASGENEDEDDVADNDKEAESKSQIRSEEEDESESEGEAEIWKAIQATNPDLHPGTDDDDGDDLLSGDDSDSTSDSENDADADADDDAAADDDDDGGASSESDSEDSGADVDIEKGDKEGRRQESEDEDDTDTEVLSLAEASDADDLISLRDVKLPEGLDLGPITYDSDLESSPSSGRDSASESEGGKREGGFTGSQDANSNKKRKRGEAEQKNGKNEEKKKRRKMLRSLPTFATYEDYAKLIEAEPEDNI